MLVFAEMYGGGSGIGYFVKKNSELGVFGEYLGWIYLYGNCVSSCNADI